jgi:hypothetical protein
MQTIHNWEPKPVQHWPRELVVDVGTALLPDAVRRAFLYDEDRHNTPLSDELRRLRLVAAALSFSESADIALIGDIEVPLGEVDPLALQRLCTWHLSSGEDEDPDPLIAAMIRREVQAQGAEQPLW